MPCCPATKSSKPYHMYLARIARSRPASALVRHHEHTLRAEAEQRVRGDIMQQQGHHGAQFYRRREQKEHRKAEEQRLMREAILARGQ